MKLDELLGEELFNQVKAKMDEVNGKEPDKLKHVRYEDLSEGNYVLKGNYDGKVKELDAANTLINTMKEDTKGNEDLQQKVATYEEKVTGLQKDLEAERLENALKIALLEADVKDVDYITYKIKADNEELKIDDNGKIKGVEEMIKGQKTAHPEFFKEASQKKVIENKLPKADGEENKDKEPTSIAEAMRMSLQEKQQQN